MGIWSLRKVKNVIHGLGVSDERESESQALWIWEEILGYSTRAKLNLTDEEENKLVSIFDRISRGEPIQYIAGHAWFYGMKLKVSPDVLIPRPETEELVHWILSDVKIVDKKHIRILDIGTGSGCIAIALKKNLGDFAHITAIDISPPALLVAKENGEAYGLEIRWLRHDFLKQDFDGLGSFDIIVSNPPYILQSLTNEDMLKHLSHEPEIALFPDQKDADIFYKKLASVNMALLESGVSCYAELNEFRAEGIQLYFRNWAWSFIEVRKDLQGATRMLKATRFK